MELIAVGAVESTLSDRASAPKQGNEGAPDAWLVLDERVADALDGIAVGDDLLLVTWLDRADRDVLWVRPRRARRTLSRACSTHGRLTVRTQLACIA